MRKSLFAALAVSAFAFTSAQADLRGDIDKDYGYLEDLYKTFHKNPELSFMEVKTAKKMAAEFKKLGFDVTEKVGKTGVVGVMKNGDGPTVMLRADMDGLPVKEETGLLTTIEVANAEHAKLALEFDIDIIWIGARTTVNPFAIQELADALRGTDKIVLVKNPVNPDLALWLGAIERLHKAGIKNVSKT